MGSQLNSIQKIIMNDTLTIQARLLNAEITKYIGQTFLGSALITLGAKIIVPFYPVPFTMQSLSVIILGLVCPPRLAVGIGTAYITQLILGIPVGASSVGGSFYGPTVGYIVGFLPMIWIISSITHQKKLIFRQIGACILGNIALFSMGYLVLIQSISPGLAWKTGVLPFIICDILKIALAISIAYLTRNYIKKLSI